MWTSYAKGVIMHSNRELPDIDEEMAFHIIVRYAREGYKTTYGNYGYEIYLPNLIRDYLKSELKFDEHGANSFITSLSPSFYAAAWELCRRGILRPGVMQQGEQATADGSSGNGYSITPRGREWLQQAGQYDFVPIEPGRFARLLDKYGARFGPGFRERCQEAILCYSAHAYLACCAMCGAAAESLILSLAIEKIGNEDKVLKDYSAAGGRGRIEKQILDQHPSSIQNEFRGYSSLLKYWRDSSAHGQKSQVSDNEAYTSLALLLRFTIFSNEKWETLVK
jgi:hypothetical protein